MEEKTYRLQSMDMLTVPGQTVDRLLALGDGGCALLYLFILRSGGSYDLSAAAAALGRTEGEIRSLSDRLGRIGVLTESRAEPALPPAEELPQYTAEDIVSRSQTDPVFKALLAECQSVMGHALSRPDLQTLFGIYDRLGLSPEAIMLLIHHCAERVRKKYGENRLPTMRTVEKEAYIWARKEVLTAAQAEDYLRWLEHLSSEETRLREVLQLTGREPSRTERSYMEQWLSMGFSAEVLERAYDITVTKTGRLTWPYMNRIVLSWQEKRLFTLEDIEKGDVRPGERSSGRAAQQKSAAAPIRDDLDYLERIMNKGS